MAHSPDKITLSYQQTVDRYTMGENGVDVGPVALFGRPGDERVWYWVKLDVWEAAGSPEEIELKVKVTRG